MLSRKCTKCGHQLNFQDISCPHCKDHKLKQSSKIKRAVLIVVGAVLLMFVILPLASKTSQRPVPTKLKQKQTEQFSKNEQAQNKENVSKNKSSKNQVNFDIEVTVSKAILVPHETLIKKILEQSNFLKSDKEYIKLWVKIKNKSNSQVSFSAKEFRMQSEKGHIGKASKEFRSLKQFIDEGELAPNGEIEGIVVFEDVQPSRNYTLLYKNIKMIEEKKIAFSLQ